MGTSIGSTAASQMGALAKGAMKERDPLSPPVILARPCWAPLLPPLLLLAALFLSDERLYQAGEAVGSASCGGAVASNASEQDPAGGR